MNSVQMHLALTHVPVILSLTGLVMLIVAFFIKNTTLTKASYILILIAGIAALPVYFSGEGTEDAVERLPGVAEGIIEEHEDVAKLATISIVIAGLAALAGWLLLKWQAATRNVKFAVLFLAVVSGGLLAQTAHLGGQIRHSEIRNGVVSENRNDTGGDQDNNQQPEKEDDDD